MGCITTLSFDIAQAILAALVQPLGVETRPLAETFGHILAEPVVAAIDSPRYDVSAMDGYAARERDLIGAAALRVIGACFAGDSTPAALGSGEAMRVMTGAPLPAGTDRVAVIERCSEASGLVHLSGGLDARPHIRRRASDFACGDIVLNPGQEMTPCAMVATAAADIVSVAVFRRPRVRLIVTGNELVQPGAARSFPNIIPDSLSIALAAFCRSWGAADVETCRAADDEQAIRAAVLVNRHMADVIVVAGGASRGDRDHCRDTLARLGTDIAFADLAIKPGKPVWFGMMGEIPVLGLPGNPTAAMTVARLFLAPLLYGLSGRSFGSALQWKMLPTARDIAANGPRDAFLCGMRVDAQVDVPDQQEASGQARLARAAMLVRRQPDACQIRAGGLVPVIDF